MAERLVTDFCERRLQPDQIHAFFYHGYEAVVRAPLKCTDCGFDFRAIVSIDFSTECYVAFGQRLHQETDVAIWELLGTHIDELARYAKGYSVGRDLVDKLHEADPRRYEALYRLKELYYRLPRDRGGGGEIWTIVSGVVLSLVSSAVYDLAKSGGKGLLSVLRRNLSRRRIRSLATETVRRADIRATLKTLTDEEIGAYLKKRMIKAMPDAEIGKLLRTAIVAEAKDLKKGLIRSAKKRAQIKREPT
jgi:hypothetical protein